MSISRPVWYVVVDNRHKRAPNLSLVWSGSGEFTCGRGLCVSHCTRSVYRALSASPPRPSPGSCRINSAHSRFMSGIDSPLVRTPSPCPREDDPLQNHTSAIMFSYCCVFRAVWRDTTELMLGGGGCRHCSSISVTPPHG